MLDKVLQNKIDRFYDIKADVISLKDKIKIFVEVPGMEMDDININIVGEYLVLKGLKKKSYSFVNKFKYIDNECPHGSFRKYIPIPSHVNKDNYNKVLDKGILYISMDVINS